MKRLVYLVAGLIFTFALLGAGTPAMAAQKLSCEIGFTGPDSNNMCISTQKYICSVSNINTVTITNDNNQQVASGKVVVSGNTTGGNTTSGTVTNTSGTVFSVTVTNPTPGSDQAGTCTAKVVVPATVAPTKPVQPTPGKGSAPAKVLPMTGDDHAMQILTYAALGAAGAALIGTSAVALYRHKNSL